MTRTFAPPSTAPPRHEEIDPGLLDQIPDVEWDAAEGNAGGNASPIIQVPSAELSALMSVVQKEMAALLAQEFVRIEASVAWLFADMEGRLAGSVATVELLLQENAQLQIGREKYERAFSALKELTREVDEQN